jgi:hypothetical protein
MALKTSLVGRHLVILHLHGCRPHMRGMRMLTPVTTAHIQVLVLVTEAVVEYHDFKGIDPQHVSARIYPRTILATEENKLFHSRRRQCVVDGKE